MHRFPVANEVLSSFARVPTYRTRYGLVIIMTEHVPVQDALVCEFLPAYMANVCVWPVFLLHMESVCTFLLESGSAQITLYRFLWSVDEAMSLKI